ncbi:MAG: hypothetical protein KAH08_01765 [Methylococcales bacterium]|nr:hypothetical protein [Methylococcales bacterium]
MTLKKNKIALGVAAATLTLAGAMVSTPAAAKSRAASHNELRNLQRQVDEMSSMMRSMQSELSQVRSQSGGSSSSKVQELDQWMQSVKAAPVQSSSKDNMVFFRGGWGHTNDNRGGGQGVTGTGKGLLDASAIGVPTTGGSGDPLIGVVGGLTPFLSGETNTSDKDAWYFGAGFDFSINNDLFGMMDNTEVAAELMLEYKEFSDDTDSLLTGQNVTVNQLTISASPKIKFLKGSKFRPWLIPVGFDLNIISPPSGAVTVLNPGIQFGLGADYQLIDNIYIGADARYHLTLDDVDGVDTDGFSVGGYLGLGF